MTHGRRKGRGFRLIPAAWVAGGEGRGAREHEEVETNLWVGLDGTGNEWRTLVSGELGTAARLNGGKSVLAEERRGWEVGELHWVKVK